MELWTGILSVLPAVAKLVLAVQGALGVNHPTVAGSLAEWVLRGDRRAGPADPPPEEGGRRLLDRIGFSVGVKHSDPSQDPPT